MRGGSGGGVLVLIAHRIALDPTHRQRTAFARGAGTARFAWNWALAEWGRQRAARAADPSLPAPSEAGLRRRLNAVKRDSFPWIKAKGRHDSFCAANEAGTFRCEGRRIRLPRVGWVRMREAVRFAGPLKRVTVSREAGRWFASVLVDTAGIRPVAQPRAAVGVDLGITALATLSDGTVLAGPRAHKALLGRLRRTGRALSRKRQGSANRRKAKARLARLHARIAAIRRDATHKATTMLVRTYARIGIEDLNVRGMSRNRHLARSILDAGFFEFRRQLAYKARMYGATVVVADRWFPSSKTCSCCGSVKAGLALSQRTFACDACNHEAPRDLNAAINLERLAASSAVTACGEERSGAGRKPRVKRTSAKQEPDSIAA